MLLIENNQRKIDNFRVL